ncbi:MAG: hypothetical protein AAFX56_11760 [Pseudomonadota bacterium]
MLLTELDSGGSLLIVKSRFLLPISLTAIIGVLFAIVYGGMAYEESECAAHRSAHKAAIANCLVMGAVFLVADHFVQNGHYPTRDDWESYVVNNWYPPGEMGCTPSSVGGRKRLVDSTGAPVIYDYVSATEVYVYAEASRSRTGGIYHLENGELNRVSEIPRRLVSHRHPFPRRARRL